MYPNGSVFHMNFIGLDVAKDASHIQAYFKYEEDYESSFKVVHFLI